LNGLEKALNQIESIDMDGQSFIVRSGEMHYPRIPREYWTHRLKMARALGLNTVGAYIFLEPPRTAARPV
jgi:beta-galactosidase